jgi:hypothetical protein
MQNSRTDVLSLSELRPAQWIDNPQAKRIHAEEVLYITAELTVRGYSF